MRKADARCDTDALVSMAAGDDEEEGIILSEGNRLLVLYLSSLVRLSSGRIVRLDVNEKGKQRGMVAGQAATG